MKYYSWIKIFFRRLCLKNNIFKVFIDLLVYLNLFILPRNFSKTALIKFKHLTIKIQIFFLLLIFIFRLMPTQKFKLIQPNSVVVIQPTHNQFNLHQLCCVTIIKCGCKKNIFFLQTH